MWRWLWVACTLLTTGCGESHARVFAVTITDAATIDCTGHAAGLLADLEQLEELADEARKAWKRDHAAAPPTPEGRTLHVNELEVRMHGWFEGADDAPATVPSPWEEGSDPRDGLPPDDPNTIPPLRFDDRRVVYQGTVQTDLIEGSYADRFNTDEADDEAGLRLCGDRDRARGALSLTTSGGLKGRVRWTDVIYLPSEFSACEGRIECARDIVVEGLEVD